MVCSSISVWSKLFISIPATSKLCTSISVIRNVAFLFWLFQNVAPQFRQFRVCAPPSWDFQDFAFPLSGRLYLCVFLVIIQSFGPSFRLFSNVRLHSGASKFPHTLKPHFGSFKTLHLPLDRPKTFHIHAGNPKKLHPHICRWCQSSVPPFR